MFFELYAVKNFEKNCFNQKITLEALPLDLALNLRQFETAKILCENGANVNQIDNRGKTFIAKAIEAGKPLIIVPFYFLFRLRRGL
jgi:ankyrin repeat protein